MQNIINIIKILKSMESNKCIHNKKFMKMFYISISYDFSKFNGFRKNQSVTFLMIPPKNGLSP
jgi:hypothetical protein